MPRSQGHQRKPVQSQLREMDKRQSHQPLMPTHRILPQANSMDSDSQPMRTALLALQHHSFRGDYAKGSPNRQEGDTELTPWLAQNHPLGEGYRQACTVLGPVQGKEHGAQTLPKPHGQEQKLAPSPLRERDKRLMHQPRTQHASRLSSNPCTARGDWVLHPEDLSQPTVHPTQ